MRNRIPFAVLVYLGLIFASYGFSCESNDHCPQGQVCVGADLTTDPYTQGQCVSGGNGQCSSGSYCGRGQICVGGSCFEDHGQCVRDRDCSNGDSCVTGWCVGGSNVFDGSTK